jgi:5'-3' exonuclease
MILVDFSGISHSMVIISWSNAIESSKSDMLEGDDTEQSFEDRFALELRARILDNLLKVKQEFAKSDEEVVICIDSKLNWRKKVFPQYKANRKNRRDDDVVDWKLAFNIINDLVENIKSEFFFKVIKWEDLDNRIGCEADDIIATLARYKSGRESITIISDDSDFYQLHDITRLKQYNYRKVQKTWKHAAKSLKIGDDKFVTPNQYKLLKILDGDRKDGVPNFQNGDDVWTNKEKGKYKRLGGKTALKILENDDKCIVKYGFISDISDTDGFKRNKKMIDLEEIPGYIKDEIIEQYIKFEYTGSLYGIQNYLSKNVNTASNYLYDSASKFLIRGISGNKIKRRSLFKKS